MSREPIFEELADGLSGAIRHRRHETAPHAFRRDLRTLPAFAATVKARGWNGLHMYIPDTSRAEVTGSFEAVGAGDQR